MSTQQTADDDVSGDLSGSYLKQSDFENDSAIMFTIRRVEKKAFEAKNGRPAEEKWVLTFDDERCFGLNKTNLRLMVKWFSKHWRTWIGKKITVYRDESISFGGRLVGGLRIRRPAPQDIPAFVTDFVNELEPEGEAS
jgi:hypothetical protein